MANFPSFLFNHLSPGTQGAGTRLLSLSLDRGAMNHQIDGVGAVRHLTCARWFTFFSKNNMPQDLPRIVKGFRTEVCLKLLGLFFIPFVAMGMGAYRSQMPPNEDAVQILLKGVIIVGGLIWLLALPYFLLIFTPKCESCKVRTKPHGKLNHDNDEWKITICPQCRERFMHRMFGGDPS
jgi:hypothetical protein